MKFIFSYLKKYAGIIMLGMVLKLTGTSIELAIPYVMEHLIDDVAPTKNVAMVLFWGCVMLLLAFTVRTFNVKANRLAVGVARDSTYEIRRDLFSKTLSLSGNQTDQFGLPSLTSRMTSDSYNVQSFIQFFQTMGVRGPIMLIGGICITMTMDVGLASILAIMVPILLVIVIGVSFRGIPLYEKVQASVDDIVRIMRENITGVRVIKALSKENYEIRRFRETNEQMAKNEILAGVVMALPGPLMQMFINCGLTLVVVVGAIRVNNGLTEPGVILAFLTYFNMILFGVMGLNRLFMMMSKANASAKRIEAVCREEEELTAIPESEAAHTDSEDYIVFEHVDFRYGKDNAEYENRKADKQKEESHEERNDLQEKSEGGRQNALTDIDFSIPRGGSLGIIGPTGCGKTTILNLLMRFYDPTGGHIFVDGRDVRTYEQDQLHRLFGVVFQNDIIFADTLAENISFGRDVDGDGLRRAAEDAKAMEFIGDYGNTFEHKAAIHGADMSGGQKQRILISRALAADPQILILDDSSSALDYKTDAALRKAIRENHSHTTTITVAQRISSIMNHDQIIMLDEGQIIGKGTHEELLASCAPYREIFKTQMGEGR